MTASYHERVGAYFDTDAEEFDARYWANPILQRIRQAFREEVKRYPFSRALEIGCGTGLDVVHFATIYPDRSILGIDVSPRMVELTRTRIAAASVPNASAEIASADDAPSLADGHPYDLVYVFFGALNTVEDLNRTADLLYEAVAPGGRLVLSFVNKWYLVQIPIELLRGRFRNAFARFGTSWGGYSPDRHLESHCRTPGEVRRAFGRGGRLLHRRGFSILYPAWYRSHWLPRLGRLGRVLWAADRALSRTPAWSTGEYALYVYRKDGAPSPSGV